MKYGWVSITEANDFLKTEAAGQSWAGPSVPLPLTGTVEASPTPGNAILGTGTLFGTEVIDTPTPDYILLSDDMLAIVQAIADTTHMTVDRIVNVDVGSPYYKLDAASFAAFTRDIDRKKAALTTAYREILSTKEINIPDPSIATQNMKDAQCLRALEILMNPIAGVKPGPRQGIASIATGDASVSYFANNSRWGGEQPFSPRIMFLLSNYVLKRKFGGTIKTPDDYGL